jgi:hypothetical protein
VWLRDAELALRTAGEESAGTGRTMLAGDGEIERLVKLGGVSTARAPIPDERGDVRGCIALNRQALEIFPEAKMSIRSVAAVNLSDGLPAAGQRPLASVAADRPRAHGGRPKVRLLP